MFCPGTTASFTVPFLFGVASKEYNMGVLQLTQLPSASKSFAPPNSPTLVLLLTKVSAFNLI